MKPMAHLNETQILDGLDGRLDPSAAVHVASCQACSERLGELRAVLQTIEAADRDTVPEPSPLFWDQFPARVNRAIDAEPKGSGWLTGWQWWGSVATAAVVVLMLILPMRRETTAPSRTAPAGVAPVVEVASELVPLSPENLDDDEAWAMVRAVAEETEYDDVQSSGLSPRAESVERAAMELSDAERAELVRLIEQDERLIKQQLKRTGASLP